MKPRKDDAASGERQGAVGSIRCGEIMLASEACRRLRWGRKTFGHARRQGLPAVKFGRLVFIRGDDVVQFFSRLAAEQNGENRGQQPSRFQEDQ